MYSNITKKHPLSLLSKSCYQWSAKTIIRISNIINKNYKSVKYCTKVCIFHLFTRLDNFSTIGVSGVVTNICLSILTGIGVSSVSDSWKLFIIMDKHVFICNRPKRFPATDSKTQPLSNCYITATKLHKHAGKLKHAWQRVFDNTPIRGQVNLRI